MTRLLLVAPTTSYQTQAFVEACRRAGAEPVLASDRCHVLDEVYEWPDASVVIDFYHPEAAARVLGTLEDIAAVVPVSGEGAAVVAAMAAERLGLTANSVAAARAAANKRILRELLSLAGVPSPRFVVGRVDEDASHLARRAGEALGWPVVLKPLLLSGSRGVMRADDPASFQAAFARLARLLAKPELREMDPEAGAQVLVESFVPGAEVALEGLLTSGRLETLALFDKPDPLEGPVFEETLYVTPSRLPDNVARRIRTVTQAACHALGLITGPVHAELRLSPDPVVLEVAARSIGGLCSRTLRFGTGLSLEDVIVRHALGHEVVTRRERSAAGVLMLPIPRAGVLKSVSGVDDARAVPHIEDVTLTIEPGRELVPLPEGQSYLGFVFARADSPEAVESALRAAQARLHFEVTPILSRPE